MVYKKEDYREEWNEAWCPQCGDFGIREACYLALEKLQLDPHKTVIVSGIGCSSKGAHDFKVYAAHTLHGRPIPVATGIKLANPNLKVIVHSGDGDCYGIGAGHFVNVGRYNVDLTVIVFDNSVYALTKGQASPTLKKGEQPKSLPVPNIKDSINPIGIALEANYSFIAQGYAYDVKGLAELIANGINNKGISLINVKQPCPTYDTVHTMEYYTNAIRKLNDAIVLKKDLEKPIYVGIVKKPFDNYKIGQHVLVNEENYEKIKDFVNIVEFKRAGEVATLPKEIAEDLVSKGYAEKFSEKHLKDLNVAISIAEKNYVIPLVGKIYENRNNDTYEERIAKRIENYFEYPPASQIICDNEGKPTTNIEPI